MLHRMLILFFVFTSISVGLIAQEDAIFVDYDEMVEGQFTFEGSPITYQFDGQAGEVIVIEYIMVGTVTSRGGGRRSMEVIRPNGRTIRNTNLNRGVNFGRTTRQIRLDNSGIYTVIIDEPNTEGNFEFTIHLETLSDGEMIEERFWESTIEYYYTVDAAEGDTVSIIATGVSGYADVTLKLENAEGDLVSEDDDSGGNLDARIGPIVIDDEGPYVVIVSTINSLVSGTFQLSIIPHSDPVMDYDHYRDVELTSDSCSPNFQFYGTGGDVPVFRVNDGPIELISDLIAPDGTSVEMMPVERTNGEFLPGAVLPITGYYKIMLDGTMIDCDSMIRLWVLLDHQYDLGAGELYIRMGRKLPRVTIVRDVSNAEGGSLEIDSYTGSYSMIVQQDERLLMHLDSPSGGMGRFDTSVRFSNRENSEQRIQISAPIPGTTYFRIKQELYYPGMG